MTRKKSKKDPLYHGLQERPERQQIPGDTPRLAESDPLQKPFLPENLDKTVLAIPLIKALKDGKRIEELQSKSRQTKKDKAELESLLERHPQAGNGLPLAYDVIIDLNLDYSQGRSVARERVQGLVSQIIARIGQRQEPEQGINLNKSQYSNQYLFGRLEGDVIRELVNLDDIGDPAVNGAETSRGVVYRAIYRIWPDFKVRTLITTSSSTVKADAARASYSAFGENIVWGVMDSGIDGHHPHFAQHRNLELDQPLTHRDLTGDNEPLRDGFGHGTHVAGIIAGELTRDGNENPAGTAPGAQPIRTVTRHRDENGDITYEELLIDGISGMAPRCKLLSLKVLNDSGDGLASNLIAAIEYVQELNGYGRRIQVHGVNMSVGYDFEPEWFACGQSPLCVEVNRLVRSGVVVVVAAGNTGYGWAQSAFRGTVATGMDLTINDPGNADLAITVGSTHRNMPHVYGVSYFSSKGPTGDGRTKPDLVAPGEKILSCAAGQRLAEIQSKGHDCNYLEESGTSMAAPHVSGVIAAFLSIRTEFIDQPEQVKQIFLSTATDLHREKYFQGHGLVDLMRAIQSV